MLSRHVRGRFTRNTATPRTFALWQAAHALLTALFNLFGAPQDIAAQGMLTKDARALLLTWLRAAEAILRRLLYIEASKLSADGRPPSKRPIGKAPAAPHAQPINLRSRQSRFAARVVPLHAFGQ